MPNNVVQFTDMKEIREPLLPNGKKSKQPVFKNHVVSDLQQRKIRSVAWPIDFHRHVRRLTNTSFENPFVKALLSTGKRVFTRGITRGEKNVYIRYAIPVLSAVLAFLIRMKLIEVIKQDNPFLLFFAPIIVSSWFGGLGPGIFATILNMVIINQFFLHSMPGNTILLSIFFLEGLLCSVFSAALNAARSKALENALEATKHQDTLEESEERYRLLVSDIKDYAIFMLDNEGQVASWNEGARRILGYEEQEILGKHFSLFFTEYEIQEGRPEEELRTTVIEGRLQGERLYVRKDGTTFWASITVTAIQDETKKLRGFAKVVRDITERRLAEQERNQLLKLEQAARKEAQEAVRARDEFLSIASHELKTPLTSMLLQIQSGLRIVANGSLELSPERVVNILKTSEQQSKRLATLINTLLDVSRITAGRLNLEISEVNLSAIVEDIVKRFHEEIKRSGSKISLSTRPTVKGNWDKLRLEQIITNLVSNAIKYGKGKPIEIQVEQDSEFAKLIIKDKGIGIARKDSERIFARFERAVAEREYKGMGVGLYIVRKIIEAHGGEIVLKSKVGAGSTFTITLPLRRSQKN